MKNLGVIVLISAAMAVFLGLVASLRPGVFHASRLPNLPAQTKFKLTASIVELKPDDLVLAGKPYATLLNDIPKRSQVGLRILARGSGSAVRMTLSKIVKQGESFDLSYEVPKERDIEGKSSYLTFAKARVSLESVDTLLTAETNVTGCTGYYADRRAINGSCGGGQSIIGYDCFGLGMSNMVPLYLQHDSSAWIVVTVQKFVD
jgi:hypothetical protein